MNELNPLTLPLSGRQLIEASAGTGKTYNITRIYIRLLLEQKIQVQNILVMTFTNAATQELRLRLDAEIRLALQQWSGSQDVEDDFYQQLTAQYSQQEAQILLNRALQNLDQASVFTIHGFCKRVLADQAFESQMRFDAQIDTNMTELYLQAVQDWYRSISFDDQFLQIADSWPTPELFYNSFGSAIKNFSALELPGGVQEILDWKKSWSEERELFLKQLVTNRRSADIRQNWQNTFDELERLGTSIDKEDEEQYLLQKLGKQADIKKKAKFFPDLALAIEQTSLMQQRKIAEIIQKGIFWCRAAVSSSKSLRNALDFDDLVQTLSVQLEQSANNRLAEVLAEKYPIALVDEFQDTDALQYGILNKIYNAKNARLLVMIGDPKQAIYGFRGGDIFAYLQARETADNHWQMSTNYRSTQGVITGYNTLFSATKPSSFDFEISYQNVNAGLVDKQELSDPLSRSAFQWVFFDGDKLTKDSMADLANWTSSEIIRLTRDVSHNLQTGQKQPVSFNDIAILVRSRGEADIMRKSLKQHNLESVYLSNRENLWQSDEARQLLILLKGVQKPENNRLFVATLSTHWFSLSLDELHLLSIDDQFHASWLQKLEQLHEHWQKHGLLSMAFKILSGSYHPGTDQRDRRLTNDIHLLETVQEAGNQFSETRELILWLEQQINLESGEKELRLESDEQLIKIVTLHGSKGLEYPVVFLPFVSYGSGGGKGKSLSRVHENNMSQLVILPDKIQIEREQREQEAEFVRLLYVAATRAEKRLYLLAAPFARFSKSALGLTLRTDTFESLHTMVQDQFEHGSVLMQALPIDVVPSEEEQSIANSVLDLQKFSGKIERDWWLSSFTALSRNVRHDGLSAPERETENEELVAEELEVTDVRFQLPKGAQSGNLLHWILEEIDFSNIDFIDIKEQCLIRFSHILNPIFPDNNLNDLESWIGSIANTQLDENGLHLVNLGPQACLKETEFYFPMQVASDNRAVLSRLLADHRQSDVEFPQHHRLKGMMHGFIDLIFEWQGKFYICDYKSNWLGDSVEDYNSDAMNLCIQQNFYDLQYWIYSLALHRYLKVKLPNYKPELHLGGVYYLFLRGMKKGAQTGIYYKPLELDWLNDLDTIFSGIASETETKGDQI